MTRGAEGIDLAPDGSAVWVAGVASRNEEAKISVIDPKSNSVVRTITTAMKLPNRLKFTPYGTRVVVSDPGTNELSIFDVATGDVVRKIATAAGPAGILITPDGLAYVITSPRTQTFLSSPISPRPVSSAGS